jgi:PAS domain S-box-containing protein
MVGRKMVKSLEALIPADTLGTVDTDHAIVMLWSLDGSRILAASKPALRLFNVFDEAELTGRRFGPALQSTTKIAELGRFMGLQDPPRVERLRLFLGMQSEVITCLCQRIRLNDGMDALMLISREQKRANSRWIGATSTATHEADIVKNIQSTHTDNNAKTPVRFVFETDENSQISSISPQLTNAFGLTEDQFIGHNFTQIGEEFGLVGIEQLNEKLASRQTWQGVTLLWPMPKTEQQINLQKANLQKVSVELSGLPVLTQAREFRGFRGFGLIRFDRLAPVELTSVELLSTTPITPVVENSRSETISTAMSAFKTERAERLSQSERNAFREIAKALGAPVPVEENAPVIETPDIVAWNNDAKKEDKKFEPITLRQIKITPEKIIQANSIQTKPIDISPTHERALLDRLPIGVLILQDQQPLFLNQTLLDLLDYINLEEFIAENAIENLFQGDGQPETDDSVVSTVKLRARSDESITVAAHLQTIEFEAKSATLISFRKAQAEVAKHVEVAKIEPVKTQEQPAPKLRVIVPQSAPESELTTAETLSLTQALREANRERDEMRAVLDTATDGVISLDSECRIINLSRSAEALFGVSQNDMVGERLSALLAGDSHATAMDYFDGVKSGGVASLLNDGRDVIGREKKGGRIPLFMTLGRISDHASGKFCAVLRDLTAWKKAEAELTESRRVAERASAMKSDFLAKISHEIRTPMNAIIGFAEVMQTEQLGPIGHERYKEYLGDIHSSGEHVVSLVNDLLDLSKIEAGQADLSFTSVDLNIVVQDCVSMMQPQAARDKVIIRTHIADKLPCVVADTRSIKQILLNLLSNATKFNQPGGQVVVSTALNDEGEAVIRVRDTGIGMNDKEMEAAMQPFRQVSTTRRGGGTGLGLPLTKALVEANRASLNMKSTPKEGTLAEVVFPATRVLAE